MDGNMIVKDLFKAIQRNEIKVADLAERYGFSDRTIQARIRHLGFVWDTEKAKHEFVGDDESVLNMPIDEVFKSKVPIKNNSKGISTNNSPSNSQNTDKNKVTKEVNMANKEVASSVHKDIKTDNKTDSKTDSNKTPETATKKDSKETGNSASNNKRKKNVSKASDKASNKAIDDIDLLLAGKKSKKEYRGFYLDSDVVGIIDGVNSGVKSELVNKCLRKVFKEKGLL